MNYRLGAKTIGEDKVISEIERQYQLKVGEASLLEGGCTNAGWRLDTDKGKYVAKIFGPDEGSKEWINNEAKMYQYLVKRGINAPEVMDTIGGQAVGEISTPKYKYPVIVMKLNNLRRAWASEIKLSEMEAVGQETAKIHQILKNFPGKTEIENRFYPEAQEEEAKKPSQILGRWKEWSKEEREQLALAEKNMYEYLTSNPLPPNLPQTIVHADLALEHTQFLDNGGVYFFDFSDRKVEARVEDIGTFLAMIYAAEDIDYRRWKELRGWFLAGYESVAPLLEAEKKAVNNFIIRRILGMSLYLAILVGKTPSRHIVEIIRKGYRLGNYIC